MTTNTTNLTAPQIATEHYDLDPAAVEAIRVELAAAWRAAARAQLGVRDLGRIEGMLDILDGRRAPPRQAPRQVVFGEWVVPGLENRPWWDEPPPWAAAVEAAWPEIQREVRSIVADGGALVPYRSRKAEAAVEEIIDGTWTALYFMREQRWFPEVAALCPTTAGTLEGVPLATEAMFSVLAPGTTLRPHSGYLNYTCTYHLGVIVPSDCALRVADEVRSHEEGRSMMFESSFVHEAWNRSDAPRVALLLDCWHPDLTEVERRALEWIHPRAMQALAALTGGDA